MVGVKLDTLKHWLPQKADINTNGGEMSVTSVNHDTHATEGVDPGDDNLNVNNTSDIKRQKERIINEHLSNVIESICDTERQMAIMCDMECHRSTSIASSQFVFERFIKENIIDDSVDKNDSNKIGCDYDILDIACGIGNFGNYLIERLSDHSYPARVDNRSDKNNENNDIVGSDSIHIKIDGIDISNYSLDYLKSNLNKKILAIDFGQKIEQIRCDYNIFIEAYGFDLNTNVGMIDDINTGVFDASKSSNACFVKKIDMSDCRERSQWRDFLDDKSRKYYDLIVSNDFFLQDSAWGRPGLQGLYDCLKLLKPNGTIVIANSRSVSYFSKLVLLLQRPCGTIENVIMV